ncbi:MAG: hypothetical protein D6744_06445, partial [Planctomycetota bacterium]
MSTANESVIKRFDGDATPANTARGPRRVPLRRIAAGALIVVASATAVAWRPLLSPRTSVLWGRDVRILARLRSDSPAERKRAAWKAIDSDDPRLLDIVRAGALGGETDDDVREAFVYALGKRRNAGFFEDIASVIRNDPSGYVRAAAWLAAARSDPRRTQALAADPALPDSDWDRLGRAQGLLAAGDASRVGELLDWAQRGDASQRVVAARALYKWLRPALDSVGRWPLGADVREGEVWPAEFIDELRRRCAQLDLQAVIDDMRPHLAEIEHFRSQLRRVTSAR